jgi:spore maturation protein CgeB
MGHIAHYASEKEFKEKIRALNGSQQTPLNEALIQLVKERHTFDHRASKILSVIAQIKQKLII